MLPLKQLLLAGYYHASWPLRRWQERVRSKAAKSPALIVVYHRIADDAATSWTSSFGLFKRQIDWLSRHFEMVSLEESQRRIRKKSNTRTCVTITFDDGYAVNNERALPLLADRKIPCTYFVATDGVLRGEDFPHDVRLGIPSKPNTIEELRHWAGQGIDIGHHTRTHRDLGSTRDHDILWDEIATSRQELQTALGREVGYFAFPFGQHANLNAAGFEIARQAGYRGVVSAYGGYNFPGDDPFHLQRFACEHRLISLKNWATIDPRKRRVERFGPRMRMVSPLEKPA